jgi:threonine aldolase
MRDAIAKAEVGDDQYRADPSVNRLQEEVARLLGKEAALFVPTGTMANQIALRVFTRPGDDVITQEAAHVVANESGASGANAGVQFTTLGDEGLMTVDELEGSLKPVDHAIYPPTTLLVLENTHNQAGGIVVPVALGAELCATARAAGVATYLDGARLFNAAVALGVPARDLADPFDAVAVSLAKGLGAPAGSVLAASAVVIERARRLRRMLGGGMGQIGFIAAAGSWALTHHVERLVDDHANALRVAQRLAESQAFSIDLSAVQTNIVRFRLADDDHDPEVFSASCRAQGILLNAYAQRTLRIVTHMNVGADACDHAADVMVSIAEQFRMTTRRVTASAM